MFHSKIYSNIPWFFTKGHRVLKHQQWDSTIRVDPPAGFAEGHGPENTWQRRVVTQLESRYHGM